MHQYGTREIEKLLRLPRSTIRAFVEAGFVTPSKGPRQDWRFSFQDMIVLRAAQALSDAKIPPRRITRSLQQLRSQLPEEMPLSGLSIAAVGDRVVVRDGSTQRQADSGQYLLAFDGPAADMPTSVIELRPSGARRPASSSQDSAQEWFDKAVALELDDVDAATRAYERVITIDPGHFAARINLGRLLHEAGRLDEAETVYRAALEASGSDALLLYNLAVLLEDLQRDTEAAQAYESALQADPDMADACYNLALVCRRLQRPQEAIRYMSQYRRLLGSQVE
jgi:tetratricopeptide (TPR) repeat protein